MDALNLNNLTSRTRAEEETIEERAKDKEYDGTKAIKSKRPRTTFALVQITKGSILSLDIDEKTTVKTIDDKNMVELSNGDKKSMSEAADILMQERGKKWQGVSGPWHFIFEGESLWERRLRMEKEGLI